MQSTDPNLLDVSRSRSDLKGDALKLGEARSALAVTRATLREGGMKGLWAGTKPAIVRVGLGIGVYMSVIEVSDESSAQARDLLWFADGADWSFSL